MLQPAQQPQEHVPAAARRPLRHGPRELRHEFRYDKIQWETGDASGGSNGLSGSSARAGYSNGDPANPAASLELSGSAVNGAFLDTAPTGLTRNSRNALENGRYVFAVRNGAPPTGGRISGATLAPDGSRQPGVQVQACPAGGGASACVNGRSNTLGNYTLAATGRSPRSRRRSAAWRRASAGP